MPSQAAIVASIIDQFSQLNREVNHTQNQQDIQNFPALLSAATNYQLETVLQELSRLTTLEDKELRDIFDNILKTQWNISQGTALDIFNAPGNVTNSCLKEVAKVIYPDLTDEERLLKFAPGIKKMTMAVPVKRAHTKLDFELKTEEVDPGALQELSPADRIVAGDTILSASSIITCFAKLDYVKKIQADLEHNHSDLYAELLQKRPDIAEVFDILKQYKPTPREAITRLMEALKFSGSRFSGQEWAGALAGRAVVHFREYMDSLPSLLKEQIYALNAGDKSHTLKQIVEYDLWQKGDCVETAAANLGKILESAANTSALDTKPPQVTEDTINKAFAKARKPFSEEYTYPLESSVKIPPTIANVLLSKINIQDETHLIEFLRNLDIEHFSRLPIEQINKFINDAEKFQYVLIHLDFLKQKSFCEYAAANLNLFSSEKCIDILKQATPDQGALILGVLKDRPGDFLNRWEYRRILFSEERSSHYLQALGPKFFKFAIRSVSDLWEWERDLPATAINTFLQTVGMDHIKSLIKNDHDWLFVFERLTPEYQQEWIKRTDKASLERKEIAEAVNSVISVSSSGSTHFQQPTIRIKKETLAEHLEIHQFLQHVLLGEQEKAEAMVKSKPGLLLKQAEVVDYSGRKIKGTALQLALGADDAEMCEMLVPWFDELPNKGQEEKAKQTHAQFPEGWEREEEEKKKNDKVELDKVVEAIARSKTDADCEASLQAFRDYLKTKELITSGKHFNIKLLIEAFKSYDNNFDRLVKKLPDGSNDYRKVDLFWRNVIGYIQRYLPACYAQAFCQGLYSLVEEKKNLRRSVEFLNDPGIFFFPLAASSGVGYDYAGSPGGVARLARLRVGVGPRGLPMLLESYMEQNQQRCTNLCNGMETSQRAGVR